MYALSVQIDVAELKTVDSDPLPIIIRMSSDPSLHFSAVL